MEDLPWAVVVGDAAGDFDERRFGLDKDCDFYCVLSPARMEYAHLLPRTLSILRVSNVTLPLTLRFLYPRAWIDIASETVCSGDRRISWSVMQLNDESLLSLGAVRL